MFLPAPKIMYYCSTGSWEKETIFAPARKYFSPSYIVTALATLWLVETFVALAFWLIIVIKYSCEHVRSSKLNFNQSDFQAKDLINQLLEDSTLTEDKRNVFKEKLKTIPESTQQNDVEDRLENCVIFSPNSAYPSLRWLVLKFIIMYE